MDAPLRIPGLVVTLLVALSLCLIGAATAPAQGGTVHETCQAIGPGAECQAVNGCSATGAAASCSTAGGSCTATGPLAECAVTGPSGGDCTASGPGSNCTTTGPNCTATGELAECRSGPGRCDAVGTGSECFTAGSACSAQGLGASCHTATSDCEANGDALSCTPRGGLSPVPTPVPALAPPPSKQEPGKNVQREVRGTLARVEVRGRVIPGKRVEVVATGLQPGSHVTIGLAPAAAYRRSGVVAGKTRIVPSSGRLKQRIRWPHRFYECRKANGGECNLRRWTRSRVLVTLGAPDLVAKTTVAAQTRTRVVRGHKASAADARTLASAAQEILPGAKKCDSPWMSHARLVGSGYGSRISLVPSAQARAIGRTVPGGLEDIWLDLQRCLGTFPSYTDATRSSLYKQLVCHVQYAALPIRLLGSKTWDLEAWAEDVTWAQALLEVNRKCNYGTSSAATTAYKHWIVQDATDTKRQKTAWIVVERGGRLVRKHIPSIAVFDCLRQRRALGPVALDPTYLTDVVPVEGGDAGCDELPAVPVPDTLPPYPEEVPPSQSAPTLSTDTTTPPQDASGTFAETTGGVTNTWTNYVNAGGHAGQRIPAHTTVQIRCRLLGFKVQDGNRWWYRIASAPWNDAYYASADAFYNNGQTAGTLLGTPYVDERVPLC